MCVKEDIIIKNLKWKNFYFKELYYMFLEFIYIKKFMFMFNKNIFMNEIISDLNYFIL